MSGIESGNQAKSVPKLDPKTGTKRTLPSCGTSSDYYPQSINPEVSRLKRKCTMPTARQSAIETPVKAVRKRSQNPQLVPTRTVRPQNPSVVRPRRKEIKDFFGKGAREQETELEDDDSAAASGPRTSTFKLPTWQRNPSTKIYDTIVINSDNEDICETKGKTISRPLKKIATKGRKKDSNENVFVNLTRSDFNVEHGSDGGQESRRPTTCINAAGYKRNPARNSFFVNLAPENFNKQADDSDDINIAFPPSQLQRYAAYPPRLPTTSVPAATNTTEEEDDGGDTIIVLGKRRRSSRPVSQSATSTAAVAAVNNEHDDGSDPITAPATKRQRFLVRTVDEVTTSISADVNKEEDNGGGTVIVAQPKNSTRRSARLFEALTLNEMDISNVDNDKTSAGKRSSAHALKLTNLTIGSTAAAAAQHSGRVGLRIRDTSPPVKLPEHSPRSFTEDSLEDWLENSAENSSEYSSDDSSEDSPEPSPPFIPIPIVTEDGIHTLEQHIDLTTHTEAVHKKLKDRSSDLDHEIYHTKCKIHGDNETAGAYINPENWDPRNHEGTLKKFRKMTVIEASHREAQTQRLAVVKRTIAREKKEQRIQEEMGVSRFVTEDESEDEYRRACVEEKKKSKEEEEKRRSQKGQKKRLEERTKRSEEEWQKIEEEKKKFEEEELLDDATDTIDAMGMSDEMDMSE